MRTKGTVLFIHKFDKPEFVNCVENVGTAMKI